MIKPNRRKYIQAMISNIAIELKNAGCSALISIDFKDGTEMSGLSAVIGSPAELNEMFHVLQEMGSRMDSGELPTQMPSVN